MRSHRAEAPELPRQTPLTRPDEHRQMLGVRDRLYRTRALARYQAREGLDRANRRAGAWPIRVLEPSHPRHPPLYAVSPERPRDGQAPGGSVGWTRYRPFRVREKPTQIGPTAGLQGTGRRVTGEGGWFCPHSCTASACSMADSSSPAVNGFSRRMAPSGASVASSSGSESITTVRKAGLIRRASAR